MTDKVFLMTYKTSTGKDSYMAIHEETKAEALRLFIANREPTDRLIGVSGMSKADYKAWLKSL